METLPDGKFFHGDIRDTNQARDAVAGVDAIFYLAASGGKKRSIDHPIEDSEVNVIGTLCLFEEARLAKVRKFVFSSSTGIFEELKTFPIKEDHPIDPDTPYGASKLGAGKRSLSYANLECICVRYFNVFGINQRYDAYGNVIPVVVHRMIVEPDQEPGSFWLVRDPVQQSVVWSIDHV